MRNKKGEIFLIPPNDIILYEILDVELPDLPNKIWDSQLNVNFR